MCYRVRKENGFLRAGKAAGKSEVEGILWDAPGQASRGREATISV